MKKIYLFGECMVELMRASSNAIAPFTLEQSFAGDVFNSAVYLKRAFKDIDVSLVTAVGYDSFSDDMINYVNANHVSTDFVFRIANKMPGLYAIKTDDKGERTFSYWRENSAARQVMKTIDVSVINKMSEGDMFFFSGISLAVLTPEDRDLFWEMIKLLKSSGVTIVFDCNYRARLWANEAETIEQFNLAFEYCDIALPGVDDFEKLLGLTTAEQVINYCKPFNINELVVKNGERSVITICDNQLQEFAIEPVKKVVDTTSAGDSFNGVYLGARLANKPIDYAVKAASKAAACVIQHRGAIVPLDAFNAVCQQYIQ